MSLDELCPFDRLNDRGPAVGVCSLQVLECQRSMNVSFFQLRIDGRKPAQEVIARVSGFTVWGKIEHVAGADGGEPRLPDLVSNRKTGTLRRLLRCSMRMRLCASRID